MSTAHRQQKDVTPEQAQLTLIAIAARIGTDGLSPERSTALDEAFGRGETANGVVRAALGLGGDQASIHRAAYVIEKFVRAGIVARATQHQVCVVDAATALKIVSKGAQRLVEQNTELKQRYAAVEAENDMLWQIIEQSGTSVPPEAVSRLRARARKRSEQLYGPVA